MENDKPICDMTVDEFMSFVATLSGQVAYEADVARRPVYADGTPRKTWAQLGELERWTWTR